MITCVSRVLGSPGSANLQIGSSSNTNRKIGASETKFSNRHQTARNQFPQRATGCLSNTQKARLAVLSRQAFLIVHGRDQSNGREGDEFRHTQVMAACGKDGLTKCVQADYKIVESWFLDLAGQHGAAFEAQIAHGTEPRRVAMAKLEAECNARGLPVAYVVPIARAKFKRELGECTTNQIWKLVFDVRQRASRKVTPGQGGKEQKEARHGVAERSREDPF